jgi:hypothetical protein
MFEHVICIAQNRSFFSFGALHVYHNMIHTNISMINDIIQISMIFLFGIFFSSICLLLYCSLCYWSILYYESCVDKQPFSYYLSIYTYNCSLIFNRYVDVYVSLFTKIQLILQWCVYTRLQSIKCLCKSSPYLFKLAIFIHVYVYINNLHWYSKYIYASAL